MRDLIVSQKKSGKTFVVSDLHGVSLETFQRFVSEKIKDNDELIICGDILDRGSDSIELLLYIMQNQDKIKIILGNHEVSFLCAYALTFLNKNDEDIKTRQKIENFFNSTRLVHLVSKNKSTKKHMYLAETIYSRNAQKLLKFKPLFMTKEIFNDRLREIFDFLYDQPLCRRIRPQEVTEDSIKKDFYFVHSNLPENYCTDSFYGVRDKPYSYKDNELSSENRIDSIWWDRNTVYTVHPNTTIYCGHDANRAFIKNMEGNCSYHNLDFCSYGSGVIVAENIDDQTLHFTHSYDISIFPNELTEQEKKFMFNCTIENKILRTNYVKNYLYLEKLYTDVCSIFQKLQENDPENCLWIYIEVLIQNTAKQLEDLKNAINNYINNMQVYQVNKPDNYYNEKDNNMATIDIKKLINNDTQYNTFVSCIDGQIIDHYKSNDFECCKKHLINRHELHTSLEITAKTIQKNLIAITTKAQEYTDFSYYSFFVLGALIAIVGISIPLFFQGYRNYFFSNSIEYNLNPVLEKTTNTIQQITMQRI